MLKLKLRLGDDIYLGDKQLVIKDCLTDPEELEILWEGMYYYIPIVSEEGTGTAYLELLPDVHIRAMYANNGSEEFNIGLSAPNGILILTGRNYRKKNDEE